MWNAKNATSYTLTISVFQFLYELMVSPGLRFGTGESRLSRALRVS